ncbi:MAG: hypothetical protein K2X03_29660 [Bryobacteraceae bacterium]|nr:hypothetical protein [Bryobacteraceae bacterium]
MAELDPKLRAIVAMAASVLPREIGCDDCFDYFAAYAEHLLAGGPLPEPLQMVGEHLERCSCCMEELNLLLAAMKASTLDEAP